MTLDEVMRELESRGTEQNRKTYARHGVGPNMFGVSYANLGALKKRLKTDHALALALWETGNHDARILATMIAAPQKMDRAALEGWASALDNHTLTDAWVGVAAKTADARALAETWTASDNEMLGRAGWGLVAQLAMHDTALADDAFLPYLAAIERGIHTRPNRTREAMNNALIAIGSRNDALEAQALAAAARIGKVTVDHGDTSCKTPDAAAYIRKTRARQQARQAPTPA